MAFELKQNLKLTQQLVMTPQLQQAIKLLQLSRLELVDLISQEMEENPLLEEIVSDEYPEDVTVSENDISETVVDREEIKTIERTEEITGEGDGKEEFDWNFPPHNVLQGKILSKIDFSCDFGIRYRFWFSFYQNSSLIHNVGPVAYGKRLSHIMIRDHNADSFRF